jgi:cold shock CspA family protein
MARPARVRLARVFAETRAAAARTKVHRVTLTGTVVRLLADKGFGFIQGPDDREYFFHRSAAPEFDRLDVGSTVHFLPTEAPKGPRAESVVRA